MEGVVLGVSMNVLMNSFQAVLVAYTAWQLRRLRSDLRDAERDLRRH